MGVGGGEVAGARGLDEELAAADEEQDVVGHGGEGVGHGSKGRGGGGGSCGGGDVGHEAVADNGGVERGADHAEVVELADEGAGEAGGRVERGGHCCCRCCCCNWVDVDELVGDVDADGEEGRCERDFALRAVKDGAVGPGRDDDNVAALGMLDG